MRIFEETFASPPFQDSSYGKEITKLSFEGPLVPKLILRALEYFDSICSLEFGHGFFINDVDVKEMDELNMDSPITVKLPKLNSFTINCDVKSYIEMKESDKNKMHSKIIFLLKFASDNFKDLNCCDLLLPNTSEVDEALNSFIAASSCKGQKTVDYSNRQVVLQSLLLIIRSWRNYKYNNIIYDPTFI